MESSSLAPLKIGQIQQLTRLAPDSPGFCCRFNSLLGAADNLTRASAPDLLLAEPVGSCTDLIATVSYPLRRIYGDRFTVAPLSVLIDPTRAARILGLAPGRSFSEKVTYVYRKQLEEADLIVVNKCDGIRPESCRKSGSSAKSVDGFRLREVTERVVQGDF